MTQDASNAVDFFETQFGLDSGGLERTLGTALERKIDYADIFCEYTTSDSVVVEEGALVLLALIGLPRQRRGLHLHQN